MSKKLTRLASSAKPTLGAPSPIEQQALLHLDKGRYRDAIECYKNLLKIERRPHWLSGLASAYSGRAIDLAAKGMLREAIDLWHKRADLCGVPLWEGPYVGWLTKLGRLSDVVDHLASQYSTGKVITDGKPDTRVAALEAHLAPFILSADPAIRVRLPVLSPLLQHWQSAINALSAFAQRDAQALDTALTSIPFRSPYRDLRLVLKAMMLWDADRDQARSAFARLPEDSPFESLAAPFRALLDTGSTRQRRWAKLNPAQITVALDAVGCPPALSPLWCALINAKAGLASDVLFDLVRPHAHLLPESVATRAWRRLAPWANRKGHQHRALFGAPSLAEQACAKALAMELNGNYDDAAKHWDGASKLIAAEGCSADDKLLAALILRHVALSPHHLSFEDELDNQGAQILTESLKYDTTDSSVYLRLARFWREQNDLKRSREQIDLGLQHFPDHVALLTESVLTAMAAGAFQNAVTTAHHLMTMDPINSQVRVLTGKACLALAAKQLAANKPDAAKQKLDEAAPLLQGSIDLGLMHLLRAWTLPSGCSERLGLVRLAVATWGGGLVAGWRLVREAQGVFGTISLPLALHLLDEGGIDTHRALTASAIQSLSRVMEEELALEGKGKSIGPCLMPWQKAITDIAQSGVFDAETTLSICKSLGRHDEMLLLGAFATTARKLWPDHHVFVFLAVMSCWDDQRGIADPQDLADLDAAIGSAQQSDDWSMARLMRRLMDRHHRLLGTSDPSDLPDLSDLSVEHDDNILSPDIKTIQTT